MKNREKYREEIINLIKLENNENNEKICSSAICDFVKSNVLPNYNIEGCSGFWCITCNKMFSFWLDEEYEEPSIPEVDWDNVPVDTLVRVRDREEQEWTLMYFKGISNFDPGHKFATWCDGATSKTASGGDYVRWKYCELVEDEENGK